MPVGWVPSRTNKRVELYGLDGRLKAVALAPGASEDTVPAGVMIVDLATLSPDVAALLNGYLAGDDSQADRVRDVLKGLNTATAQAAREEQAGGQTQAATNATTGPQGEPVGVLQTPDFLNANLDLWQVSVSGADAQAKLALREQDVAQRAQAAGLAHVTPDYIRSLYGDPTQGQTGPFAATESGISETVATNPEYIRYFARAQDSAQAAELNRRQNVLAGIDLQIKSGERKQSWEDLVAEYDALLAEYQGVQLEQERGGPAWGEDDPAEFARKQQAHWREGDRSKAAFNTRAADLIRRMQRHPESATWFAERNLAQARAGTQKAGNVYTDTTGREIPQERLPYEQQRKPVPAPGETQQPPAWTANVPWGASPDLGIFGTPEQHGQAPATPAPPQAPSPAVLSGQGQGAPPQPPSTPSQSQPPRAAAPGKSWVQRPDGTWAEVDAYEFGGMSPFSGGTDQGASVTDIARRHADSSYDARMRAIEQQTKTALDALTQEAQQFRLSAQQEQAGAEQERAAMQQQMGIRRADIEARYQEALGQLQARRTTATAENPYTNRRLPLIAPSAAV